jgi:hypothetical protein
MRLLLERWTIDFLPPRLAVSVYLLVTGSLVGCAIILAGVIMLTLGIVSGVGQWLSAIVYLTPPPSPRDFHLTLPYYFFGGWAVGLFFLVATLLMWVRMPGHWVAAAVAALAGGCAWWALVFALLAPPHHPPFALAAVFVAITAVMTFGALAATLQRAPGPVA